MTAKVLIDAGNLRTGGGVQVAASFINELFGLWPSPSWLSAAVVRVSPAVYRNLTPTASKSVSIVDRKCRFKAAFRWRADLPFDVAFRVFGPWYGFREANTEIVGFADPYLPPGWASEGQIPSGLKSKLKFSAKRFFAKQCDIAWVESEAYADALARLGIPRSAIYVVPNAASSVFNSLATGKSTDQSLPTVVLPPSPKPQPYNRHINLIYPARPYAHKNHKIIPAVVKELKRLGIEASVGLTLTASECAEMYGTEMGAIRPLGVLTQAELVVEYRKADAVFFPSLLEVASATPLEANAMGKCLIASNRPFIKTQVGDAAWYCEPIDPGNIAFTIASAIENADERERKIRLGLRDARQRPTAMDRAKSFVSLIDGRCDELAGPRRTTVVVAHPVQQHSMRTAVAVKTAGAALRYCTTVYDRPGSLTNRIKKTLSAESMKRAEGRKDGAIEDWEVWQKSEFVGLILLLLQRVPFSRAPFDWWMLLTTEIFSRQAAKLAFQADVIIAYDTFAFRTFEWLQRFRPSVVRVLDMSAPASPYVARVFANAIDRAGDDDTLVRALETDRRGFLNRLQTRRDLKEIELADYFLVASKFTAKSLEALGVDKGQIHFCRYGAPNLTSAVSVEAKVTATPLRVAFVGNVTGRKGITTYLNAARTLSQEAFEFLVIGKVRPGSDFVDHGENVSFTGHLVRDDVLAHLSRSHVLVFPSFADGFGLSALEAMACGCAVVCSANAGIADLIQDGSNGVLFDAGKADQLVAALRWLNADRGALEQIVEQGRITASQCTWENYNSEVAMAVGSMLSSRTSVRRH